MIGKLSGGKLWEVIRYNTLNIVVPAMYLSLVKIDFGRKVLKKLIRIARREIKANCDFSETRISRCGQILLKNKVVVAV